MTELSLSKTMLHRVCIALCILSLSSSTTQEADVTSLTTECFNINPRYPNANELSCYRTDIQSVGSFNTCEARFVRSQNISVASRSDNFTIMYAHTPGRLRGRLYNNRLLCRWNIQCPPNQLMYLDMTEHVIEPVANSSFFTRPVCLDYLRSFRDFGTQTTCGSMDPYADLEPNRILMEFRSNRRLRFPGFNLRVVCFNPNLQDLQGCEATPINQLFRPSSSGRKKRSAPNRNTSPQSKTMERSRREDLMEKFIQDVDGNDKQSKLFRNKRSSSTVRVTIASRVLVFYISSTRLIIIWNNGRLRIFRDITSVHTYNEFSGLHSFDSANSVTIERFRGNGMLTIINHTCYYFIYGVDPRFRPTTDEEWVIRTLLDAQEAFVINDDFVIEEGPDDDPAPLTTGPVTKPKPPRPSTHFTYTYYSYASSSSSFSSTTYSSSSSSSSSTSPSSSSGSSKRSIKRSTRKSPLSKSLLSRVHNSKTKKRGRRQASGTPLAPVVTETAELSANSCNAVVRAVAQSIIALSGN